MATEKQIEANRANAQQSTGPVTEEGKTHSSRNALSHGLTSKDLCVASGHEAEFASIEAVLLTRVAEPGLDPILDPKLESTRFTGGLL